MMPPPSHTYQQCYTEHWTVLPATLEPRLENTNHKTIDSIMRKMLTYIQGSVWHVIASDS